MSPSNTAMVQGYNAIFSENKKLGSWADYLDMRDTIFKANEELQLGLGMALIHA